MLEECRYRHEDNFKMDLQEIWFNVVAGSGY
jgi:hypothetical protein